MFTRVIAHRGASGERHENSLAAFRRAVEVGADGIELDVHPTRDGAFAVHHDAVIPGAGAIADLSAREVTAARLPNGEPVPLLDEALAQAASLDVWVELKALDRRLDAALVGLLRAGPAPARYAVHSFDHRIIQRLSTRYAELRCGALATAYLMDPVRELADAGASVLWQEWNLIDQALADRVHDSGRSLIAWTVNASEDLVRLARLGVDGVCTNFPDRALRALGREGKGAR